MPELRWTLLILGALFIGGLALWELRRQRLARGSSGAPGHAAAVGARDGERLAPRFDGDAGMSAEESVYSPARGVFREPTINLPDVSPESAADSRERFTDPPIVELDDESMDALKVEAQAAVDEFSYDASEESGAADEADAPRRIEPVIPKLSPAVAAPTLAPAHVRAVEEHDEPTARFDVSEPENEPEAGAAAPQSIPESFDIVEPIVEWPDEESRKILALRLVSGGGERFAGRAVRQALAAEGFVLGKYDIFHKPGPDARAVLSAASLTKPGTFSVSTMDAQRFGGISLFAVLPGPLSPLATFDELLVTARALNDRLRGALQDERGEPLTPMRSATLRESLSAAASAVAPVVSAAAAPPVVGSPGSASPA